MLAPPDDIPRLRSSPSDSNFPGLTPLGAPRNIPGAVWEPGRIEAAIFHDGFQGLQPISPKVRKFEGSRVRRFFSSKVRKLEQKGSRV